MSLPTSHFTMPIRGEKISVNVQIRERLFHEKTEYQTIEIINTEVFGRLLLLDGHIQLTEFDERAYHELLVHVPLLSVDQPKRALVIGGGDGGVIRELCRHESLETIDMVEIDAGVVNACRHYLPTVSSGAFEDLRVNLHIADAFQFIKDVTEPYDLIVADSTDVYEGEEGNLSEMLFTREFYQDVRRCLTAGGFVVTQADNLVFCPYSLEAILKEFRAVFANTGWYQGIVPSFGGYSGFAWASNGPTVVAQLDPKGLDLAYLNDVTYAFAFRPLRFS
jgi:spermidine synthase